MTSSSAPAPASAAAPANAVPGPARAGAGTALRLTLDLARPAVQAAAGRMWTAPGPVPRYREYLVCMHATVCASVPLMRLAAGRCTAPQAGSHAPALRTYLLEHIAEETDHDRWLAEDLAAFDRWQQRLRPAPDAAAPRPADTSVPLPPPAPVTALAGPPYHWVLHGDPVWLLGYIAALESCAPHPGLAPHLAARTGLPPAVLRTVAHHADVDGGHADAVFALLDGMPLHPTQARAVRLCALRTLDALIGLFDHLAACRRPEQECSHDRHR